MKKINIGLIGFGTVGVGVAKALLDKHAMFKKRVGCELFLKRICDKDLTPRKNLKVNRSILTSNVFDILNDPEIDIVVELIGGIHPAKELLVKALNKGKHIVTANKALIAECGEEIFNIADKRGRDVYFEASVGGAIPIIKSVREGLVANHIDTILGIINGTSNYILTAMAKENLSFLDALAAAKKKGYAERNPILDINGYDCAHKIAILTLLGFGKAVKIKDIHVEGILDISLNDIRYAEEFGYVIKLLGIAKRVGRELEVRVHPTLLSKEHLLSKIDGVYNGIYLHGDMAGGQLFYGRGAGQGPAASAVVADIIDVARNILNDSAKRIPEFCVDRGISRIRKIDEIESRYYIRFSAIDKPGVLATIAGILGKNNISISSVAQKERRKARIVPVIIMTHDAKESDLRKALKRIDSLSAIRRKSVAIRVER